jgi:hypothetical protein
MLAFLSLLPAADESGTVRVPFFAGVPGAAIVGGGSRCPLEHS